MTERRPHTPPPPIDTDAHREALAERKGRPSGPHVGDKPGLTLAGDTQNDLVVYLLDRLEKATQSREAEPVTLPKNRFDWTINTGNVLVLVVLVLSWIAGYGIFIQRITADENALAQNTKDILANFQADAERSQRYVPRIEKVEAIIAAIAPRQDNQADAMRELRAAITELVRGVATMHEDMAVMKIRVERDGRGPHEKQSRDESDGVNR